MAVRRFFLKKQYIYPINVLTRFIIDGIITLPIALYGFLIFPDLPATTKAFYLTEEASSHDGGHTAVTLNSEFQNNLRILV